MKRCPKCKIIIDGLELHHCTAPGEYIYYHHANGDTYPGLINKVKIHPYNKFTRRIQITYNGIIGDKTVWVKPTNITLQGEK